MTGPGLRFEATPIAGVHVIRPHPVRDARGFFARLFDAAAFEAAGLVGRFVNINNSRSIARHTLRGMHQQMPPSAEAKLVRCVRGALFDVAVDTRPGSATHRGWFGLMLTAEDPAMLYVPQGCAHGFLTMEDETEAIYLSSAYYDSGRERGLRWDDPAIDIAWPAAPAVVSDKDRGWPDYDPAGFA